MTSYKGRRDMESMQEHPDENSSIGNLHNHPPPRGGIAIFDSMTDFVKVHIQPHPGNKTIITYQDGEQEIYGD